MFFLFILIKTIVHLIERLKFFLGIDISWISERFEHVDSRRKFPFRFVVFEFCWRRNFDEFLRKFRLDERKKNQRNRTSNWISDLVFCFLLRNRTLNFPLWPNGDSMKPWSPVGNNSTRKLTKLLILVSFRKRSFPIKLWLSTIRSTKPIFSFLL